MKLILFLLVTFPSLGLFAKEKGLQTADGIRIPRLQSKYYSDKNDPCRLPFSCPFLATLRGDCQFYQPMPTHNLSCVRTLQQSQINITQQCENQILDHDSAGDPVDLNNEAIPNICLSKAPQKYKSLFAQDGDVPAKVINLWTEERMESLWREKEIEIIGLTEAYATRREKAFEEVENLQMRAESEKDRPYVQEIWERMIEEAKLNAAQYGDSGQSLTDFQTIFALNLEASRVWNLMVLCAGGNENKARRMYYEAKFQCEFESLVDDQLMYDNVKSFLINTFTVFSTTHVPRFELKKVPKYEFQLEELYTNPTTDKFEQRFLFPATHPLLSQALLQHGHSFYRTDNNWDMKKFKKKYIEEWDDVDLSLSVNMMTALTMSAGHGCTAIGLWPAAGRAAYKALQNRLLELNISTGKIGDLKIMSPRLISTQCKNQNLPRIYWDESRRIGTDMRLLNSRYGVVEQ
ncbi:MAG: hypothetical protein CL677_06335 [Bdellovibrionaceae bacterium]|nr:hypothetical protein [Pseudobdellovibrionaceae bacterium]|tara:strand:+ start:58314 stop:59699 length:1386 start_codon:yes stop_codon:yes gene_type:complete